MEKYYFSSKSGSSLSNFHKVVVRIWGIEFVHSEQAYQYFKCIFHHQWVKAGRIRSCADPRKCFRVGRSVVTSSSWQLEKPKVMLHILKHKFHQCKEFREEL